MGIRFTGISTPIGGLEWEYTDKKEHPSELLIYPGQKIQVFISSICGKEKYDRVRSELKRHIEATGLAVVYLFEGTGASTVAAGAHYLYALEDSDVCIFLIDNADGISPGVQEEIDMVKRNNIKALYYFCDETQKEKTPLEKSLRGSQFAKSKTIHQFSELMQNGAQDFLDDIISVYHHYCKNRLNLRKAAESEDIQQVDGIRGGEIRPPTMPKTVLKNIDKSTDYYLKYALGYSGIHTPGEEEKTGEMDEWCIQFLPVLFEGKTIKQFNVALFLEALKKNQTDCFSSLVAVRWEAIQAYFMGDVDSCIKHLEKALALARELKQPSWVINDILIDLRNQQIVLDTINNRFSMPTAQQELSNSEEEIYYPLIDRVHESLYQKIAENAYKQKLTSPYSVTLGADYTQYGNWIASSLIIAMHNGSLTHILLTYDKVRDFVFILSCKYNDWRLRRNLLQLAVFDGKRKEVEGLQRTYPALLARMTAEDADAIMEFCNNQPLAYRRFESQLLGFGAVSYFLSDKAYSEYETIIVKGIHSFINSEKPVLSIGADIFKCLDDAAYRMKQESLVDICCLFMEHNFRRWYGEMFTLIANRIDLGKLEDDSAKKLLSHIIDLIQEEKDRDQIKNFPRFLYVLRKQNRQLTNKLDSLVAEYFPTFYSGEYRLETMELEDCHMADFVRQYAEQIKQNNDRQGKNGTYYGHAFRNAATIRSIFVCREDRWNSQLMDDVIDAASETLLHSKESIRTKLDSISLLICIIIKFPEDYKRNAGIYNSLYEQQESITTSENSFVEANIDSVALQVCLNLLFTAMGIDTYTTLLELLPLAQNDVATSISIATIIDEYLEVANTITLTGRVETLVLQNVLGWLHSEHLDLRCIATRILLALARNQENKSIVDRQLVNMIDGDCVYIKNLIMRRINKSKGVSDSVKEYIMNKCKSDPNYVVRMVCSEEMRAYPQ